MLSRKEVKKYLKGNKLVDITGLPIMLVWEILLYNGIVKCTKNDVDMAIKYYPFIDLSESDIEDVSMLGNVHTLDLNYCKNISDVSALDNVHTLDLSFCEDISDVSALSNVHTLDLCG